MAGTQKSYYLGAGVFAGPRLDVQYSLILQTSGGHLLDPCITYDTPGLKIADVCCGTGYFFRNIKTDPSTELHALDLDLSSLPPEAWLPNVKRHLWNVYDSPPAHLVSTFDVVNCQLLFTFIHDSKIDTVFSNIMSLLRPGGHVQWFETCFADAQFISADPTYKPEHLPRVMDVAASASGRSWATWPTYFEQVFERNGVPFVKVDRTQIEPRHWKSWTLQLLTAFEEIRMHMWEKMADTEDGRQKVEEYADCLEKSIMEATVKNCAYVMRFVRIVGRKGEVNGSV